MKFLLSLTIFLTSLFQTSYSFDNRIWRGTTINYQKGLNNKIDFKNIIYNYNITRICKRINNANQLSLKLRFYDKFGGVISYIPFTHNWKIDNNKSYISEVNFFQYTSRSLIIFNYTYDDFKKLELNSIKTSALRSGGIKNYMMRTGIMNISNFLRLIMKFNFCKTTKINPLYPNSREIKYSNKYDYKYFFMNEDRTNNIFTDNIIVSIPSIIKDYEPFTFIIGCFISLTNYKQLNFNYNYKGELISIEFNEYIYY